MTVFYSSDLGWTSGQNVTAEFAELLNGTLKSGDTLVLDAMYDMNAGAELQLPDNFTLSALNGGGFDMQNTASTSSPMILMGNGGTLDNMTITASGAPKTGFDGNDAVRGVDFDPARAVGIDGVDNVTIVDSEFSGYIGQFVNVTNSDNLVIQETHFDGARYQVLLAGDVADALIVQSHFENSMGDGIKTIDGDIVRPQVIETLFQNNNRDGIDTTGGFRDALIKDSVFIDNGSAFDIKSRVHDAGDLGRTDVNTNITIDGGYIAGSTNALVISYLDRSGLVQTGDVEKYMPNDINVTGVTFQDVGTVFLVKDGFDINWSDLTFRNVGSEAKILNINAPSGWDKLGNQNIEGTSSTQSLTDVHVSEFWNFEVGPDGSLGNTVAPSPEPIPEPTPAPAPAFQPVVDAVPEPEPEPLAVSVPQVAAVSAPATAADTGSVLYELSGATEFNGGKSSVIQVAPTDELNVAAATINFSINADTVNGRAGLLSKDATGHDNGDNHFAVYLEKGDLKVRFQADDGEQVFVFNDVQANTDYDITASFGEGLVGLWVNGELVGKAQSNMSWETNDQYLQIGANGWASKDGASGFRDVFDGTISDVEILSGYASSAPATSSEPQPVVDTGADPLFEDAAEWLNDLNAQTPAAEVPAQSDITENLESSVSNTNDSVSESDPVFEMAGTQTFGSRASVVELESFDALNLESGTVAFSFNAENTDDRQGLVSKDASGFGPEGGHFTSYIENGSLKVRFQSDTDEVTFVADGIISETDYNVAASFGDGKVAMWLDGTLVGESNLEMNWLNNDEHLQIGANGWASEAGAAGFYDVFEGTVSDVVITDEYADIDHEPEDAFFLL